LILIERAPNQVAVVVVAAAADQDSHLDLTLGFSLTSRSDRCTLEVRF
jgi:hypothetical protein